MSADSLKSKMQEFKEGKLSSMKISGEDLSSSAKKPEEEHKAVSGTVVADVPDDAKNDVFNSAGDATAAHESMTPSYLQDKIDISDADRAAFLEALVTGGRYERSFSLFGGKLHGVFRCRKIAESDGIISWVGHCINDKKVDARIEYLTLMRNAVLAAQVKSLRGLVNEDFPELQTPYAPTRSADGKELLPPGWVAAAAAWGAKPEALVTALHVELQKFEKRYWTMIADAPNQNFWNPAASI